MRLVSVALVATMGVGFGATCSSSAGQSGTAAPVSTTTSSTVAEPSFGTLNQAELERLRTIKDDRPFYMVNLMKFRAHAKYPDGRATKLTGFEANNVYSEIWSRVAARHGAGVRFAALINQKLLGDNQSWDMVAVAYYPSRAALFAILDDPEFKQAEIHKEAALERSIVLVTERLSVLQRRGLKLPPGFTPKAVFTRPDPATVPHPPVNGDHPIVLVHFLHYRAHAQYKDGRPTNLTGRQAVDEYGDNTSKLAPGLGIRPIAWFDVEGEFIGDGRTWDEVRLNWFPSRATFEALTSSEDWARGYPNREAGLADAYAFITTPVVDTLPLEGTTGDG